MEGERRIKQRGACLWADGCGADMHVFAEMCRALAVQCIESEAIRVLVDSTDCDPEGAQALRDAFTVMLLAGIVPGLRVALVTDGRAHACLAAVERDLIRLRINARLFEDAEAAADWLACTPRVAASVEAQSARA